MSNMIFYLSLDDYMCHDETVTIIIIAAMKTDGTIALYIT
jgi:hypothetical protein